MDAFKTRLEYLFKRYYNNSATDAERSELMSLINQLKDNTELSGLLEQAWQGLHAGEQVFSPDESESLLQRILGNQKAVETVFAIQEKKPKSWWRYAAAAAILLFLAGGSWVWITSNRQAGDNILKQDIQVTHDLPPGHDGAILTLANGKQVILDSAQNGTLTSQGNIQLVKQNGQLTYTGKISSSEVLYNTMTTPKGRKYELILSDGTKVTLDAASSIRYPTVFTGKERRVEITGQAYFEVTHDAAKPFIVQKNEMSVQVYGTEFNVYAYDDEAMIKTTLVRGSVKVSNSGPSGTLKTQLLTPGQQAMTTTGGPIHVDKNADVEQAIAWKNGFFQFRETDLKTIMRQIMRWYDVEVVYDENIIDRYFTADISRDKNLSALLKILELSDIHFKLQGKTLTVKP